MALVPDPNAPDETVHVRRRIVDHGSHKHVILNVFDMLHYFLGFFDHDRTRDDVYAEDEVWNHIAEVLQIPEEYINMMRMSNIEAAGGFNGPDLTA